MRLYKPSTVLLLLIGAATCLLFEDCYEKGVGYQGTELQTISHDNPRACYELCLRTVSCKYWTWKKPTKDCTLFTTKDKILEFKEVDATFRVEDVISGPKICKVPFEDLKKEYCPLSLDEKRKMLARGSVTAKQVEALLFTERMCTSGRVNSCQHTSEQVLDQTSNSPLVTTITDKLVNLCKEEKENDNDCNGTLDEKVLESLDIAESRALVRAEKEVQKAKKWHEVLTVAFGSLEGSRRYRGGENFKTAAKASEFKQSVTDALNELKTKATEAKANTKDDVLAQISVPPAMENDIKQAVSESLEEKSSKKLVEKLNEKQNEAQAKLDKAEKDVGSIKQMFGKAKKHVKSKFTKAKLRKHLGSPKSQAKALNGLGKMTTGIGHFLNANDGKGGVDPMKIGLGVMSVIDGIGQMLPAPVSTITGFVSSILNMFVGGGGPTTEDIIKEEFKKHKEFIKKQFKEFKVVVKGLLTEAELASIKENALGMLDALDSRYEFISAYENVGSCLTDEAISEITLRVRYFMDQAGAYAVKHAFNNKCEGELNKVDVRESQKTCTFLLYTYLTIEKKRHEILTIMMSLLSNSDIYEELNQGYLKVFSHQKQKLASWLKKTFQNKDTYCGLFKHHADVWGDTKIQQDYVQNIIFHFAPSVKTMDKKCQDFRCQVNGWKCNNHSNIKNIKTIEKVRNGGLCMKACTTEKRCSYWQYQVATKECSLLLICGELSYWPLEGKTSRPSRETGWIMGARKCQSVADTRDDRGNTCFIKGVTMSANGGKAGKVPLFTNQNYPIRGVESPELCQERCELQPHCFFWTYHINKSCYLINTFTKLRDTGSAKDYTTGPKRCAQGEYGATWDFGRFKKNGANQQPSTPKIDPEWSIETVQGCPNTEMCQRLCLSTVACSAWTFNFHDYTCKMYKGSKTSPAVPSAASFRVHHSFDGTGSLKDFPWVSGPRTMI